MENATAEFWQITIAGIQIWRILAFFGAILSSYILVRIARYLLEKTSALMQSRRQLAAAEIARTVIRPLPVIAFAIGLRVGMVFLRMTPSVESLARTVVAVLLSLAGGYTLYGMVDVVVSAIRRRAASGQTKLDDMLVPIVGTSLRITVIVLTLLQIAQFLTDKPLTTVLAGLGVGGLAVALAAQDTIKNFFGSLVLFADKPFQVGDRIVIDGHDGPVEQVGFRSTRIRTLQGHLVTVPNGELANKTILNIGRRPYIRRTANITVAYDTPPDKLRRAIEIVKDILNNHEGMDPSLPPRVYFNEFNSDSLNIVVMCWYHPPDYWKYCEFSERVNLAILDRFNAEGIQFAFPTRTLFLAGDPKRPLDVGIRDLPKS